MPAMALTGHQSINSPQTLNGSPASHTSAHKHDLTAVRGSLITQRLTVDELALIRMCRMLWNRGGGNSKQAGCLIQYLSRYSCVAG